MNVKIIQVGYLQTNCYILEKDGACLVIDPGDECYAIEKQIGENQLLTILVTHHHSDHVGALDALASMHSVPIYDVSKEENTYEVGPFQFQIIHNPGHSEDSISFHFESYQLLFCGDFIFKDTIGRTDLDGGNMEQMKQSIEKIKQYSDRIKLYPGHGESTKLGYEKEYNPFF